MLALPTITLCNFDGTYFIINGVEATSVGDNIKIMGYIIFRKSGE